VPAVSTQAAKPAPAADDDVPFDADEPVVAAAPVAAQNKPAQKAEDILAMIRARQQK
jgi:hypothetical protein